MKVFKNLAIYMLIILTVLSILRWSNQSQQPELAFDNFSQFVQAVEKGEVKEVRIVTEGYYLKVRGTTKDNKEFALFGPREYAKLYDVLLENDVEYYHEETPQPSWWLSLLTTLLPVLLIIGIFFLMMQQTQGGGGRVMQFGKSRAKLHSDDKKKVTFKDVAGADEVKEELEEIVDFLKNPKRYHEIGARIPRGVLLFGPPGTGKTLLARAVAGEAGVPFYSISGSDFVEMFVGVGASRVRDLFEQAKKNPPCIVFIDEIDAVGRQRGAGLGGGHDEREQTLNQLLVEMDGFSVNESVIIIAATNRPDILDPALLRPGRFDRQITVDRPDVRGREEILQVHVKGKPLDENVDLGILARGTPGFTGADLANLVNEATLLAARARRKTVIMNDLEQAIERVIAGPEKKSRIISEFEKKIVSYHEAGHALVAELLPHTDPLHKVSIIPRGRAGGYTLLLPREDRNYMTRSQLLSQITMMLGGRVAEKVVLNEISTGAQNDLERASATIRKMITEWGMSDEIGPITFGNRHDQVFLGRDIGKEKNYSEAVAYAIDKEVKRIMDECYNKAIELLEENIDKLHLIAQTLMEKETIEAEEFAELMRNVALTGKKDEIDEGSAESEKVILAKTEEAVAEEDSDDAKQETTEKQEGEEPV